MTRRMDNGGIMKCMDYRVPLAEQMRPKTLDDVVGQIHLLGETEILRQIVKNKEPVSLILWGATWILLGTLFYLI